MLAHTTVLFAAILSLAQESAAPAAPTLGKAEYVALKADDGVVIQGLLQKPTDGTEGKPAVLCIPPFNRPKEEYRSMLIALASQGITGLAIDTRGTGGSYLGLEREDLSKRVRAKDPALFAQMYRDCNAAIEYLATTLKADPAKISAIGTSVGGAIVLHAAAKNPKIASLAWVSPGESYLGLPSMEHLGAFGDRPLLLLVAKDEEDKGTAQIAASRKSNPKTETKVYDVTQAHGIGLFQKSGELSRDIFTWLRKQHIFGAPKPKKP